MGKIFKLAIREIWKRKFFSLLMFLVCLIAMHAVLASITNATSAAYQQKIFENNLGYDMSKILHLDYRHTEENPEFADVLTQYMDYIEELPGVLSVGQFDVTGMYFAELKASDEYRAINAEIVKDGKYADYADVTQLLSVDENLLTFVKGGISEFTETTSGYLPIYASEVFKDILPIGSTLTDERTGEKYELAGFIPEGSKWVEENDLIRFPMVSIDGWFVAPFSSDSKTDIMTQLSSLHNTYVLLSDSADIDYLKQAIMEYSLQHGFEATADTLAEEYKLYRLETKTFTTRQIALAVFVSLMSVSSIIAVFTTNTLLKRKQYGILIANGFTLKDIAMCIAMEITVIVLFSTLIAWEMKFLEFKKSTDLFRDILLTAHIRYTLPICCSIAAALIVIATALPAIKVFQYQPGGLIGGNTNGNY